MEKKPSKPKDFVEREWNDFTEGDYDENGFFVTPNGSFWDPDGVYFNKDGYDKHGGYYDDNNEYVPGEGWDEANNCYLDELNDYDDDYEYGSDHDEEEDDGFGDIDINNIQEALDYINNETLFKRLKEITKLLLKIEHNNIKEVMWYPDDLKLRSSMTLFSVISGHSLFDKVIDKFYEGEKDLKTIKILKNMLDTEKNKLEPNIYKIIEKRVIKEEKEGMIKAEKKLEEEKRIKEEKERKKKEEKEKEEQMSTKILIFLNFKKVKVMKAFIYQN